MPEIRTKTIPAQGFSTSQPILTEVTWTCSETESAASEWEVRIYAEAADRAVNRASPLLARTTLTCPSVSKSVHSASLEVPAGALAPGRWKLIAVLTQAQGWRNGIGEGPVFEILC